MSFTSFPYTSVKIFNVETAGRGDKDCEFGFFTEIWFDPPKCSGCDNNCSDEKPTPGMSYIEFDMNKHTTDILGLYRYVAAQVFAANSLASMSSHKKEFDGCSMAKPAPWACAA